MGRSVVFPSESCEIPNIQKRMNRTGGLCPVLKNPKSDFFFKMRFHA
jgi:hypothetical protein